MCYQSVTQPVPMSFRYSSHDVLFHAIRVRVLAEPDAIRKSSNMCIDDYRLSAECMCEDNIGRLAAYAG